jgi:hypothetical protein
MLNSLGPIGRPYHAVAVKRLRRSFTSFRPLRGDRAVAIRQWVSKASTPQTQRGAPVCGVEVLEAPGMIRAQRSSLAEGDARKRAWA